MSGKCRHCSGLTVTQAIALAAERGLPLYPQVLWNWAHKHCPPLKPAWERRKRKLRTWPDPKRRGNYGLLHCKCDLLKVFEVLLPEPPPHEWNDGETVWLSFERLSEHWHAKRGERYYSFRERVLWRWVRKMPRGGWVDIDGKKKALGVRHVYFVGREGGCRAYITKQVADAIYERQDNQPLMKRRGGFISKDGKWVSSRFTRFHSTLLKKHSQVDGGQRHRALSKLIRTRRYPYWHDRQRFKWVRVYCKAQTDELESKLYGGKYAPMKRSHGRPRSLSGDEAKRTNLLKRWQRARGSKRGQSRRQASRKLMIGASSRDATGR